MNAFRNGGDDEAKNAVQSANPAADRFPRPGPMGRERGIRIEWRGFCYFCFRTAPTMCRRVYGEEETVKINKRNGDSKRKIGQLLYLLEADLG